MCSTKSNRWIMAKDRNLKTITEINSISKNKPILRIIINKITGTNQMIKVEIDKWRRQRMKKTKINLEYLKRLIGAKVKNQFQMPKFNKSKIIKTSTRIK